jgi:ribosomal-protein-alanine N-acetyltransferase
MLEPLNARSLVVTRCAGTQNVRTERLLLRRWRPEDLAPFAALNADPAVMEFMPATLSAGESAALVERIEAGFEATG